MKCPSCDHAEMVKMTQDEKLSFGGQSLTLHGMKGEFCPKCDEGVWDAESYRRYAEAQAALLRAVKGDLSADIRRIRKNLNLTQAELSEVFGVGKLAFSRYERGKTQPPAPLVKLLKLVERHPDLMNEVREVSTSHSLIDRPARISGNQQAGLPVSFKLTNGVL